MLHPTSQPYSISHSILYSPSMPSHSTTRFIHTMLTRSTLHLTQPPPKLNLTLNHTPLHTPLHNLLSTVPPPTLQLFQSPTPSQTQLTPTPTSLFLSPHNPFHCPSPTLSLDPSHTQPHTQSHTIRPTLHFTLSRTSLILHAPSTPPHTLPTHIPHSTLTLHPTVHFTLYPLFPLPRCAQNATSHLTPPHAPPHFTPTLNSILPPLLTLHSMFKLTLQPTLHTPPSTETVDDLIEYS